MADVLRVGPEGVEPSSSGYQPSALPLSYGPMEARSAVLTISATRAGGIRTPTSRLKRPICCLYTTTPAEPFKAGRFSRFDMSITSIQVLILFRERRHYRKQRVESRPQESGRPSCGLLTTFSALLLYFWPPRGQKSGRPDSNRRFPAPKAGGLPDFPTSRAIAREGVEPSSPP